MDPPPHANSCNFGSLTEKKYIITKCTMQSEKAVNGLRLYLSGKHENLKIVVNARKIIFSQFLLTGTSERNYAASWVSHPTV